VGGVKPPPISEVLYVIDSPLGRQSVFGLPRTQASPAARQNAALDVDTLSGNTVCVVC